jgi:hypothetical protein
MGGMDPEEARKKAEAEANQREILRIFQSSKRFADNARVLIAEGHMVITLYVGESSEIFVLTPHHAKRLSQLLASQVASYEAQQGNIPASFQTSILSPIQPEKPPKNEGGEAQPPASENPKGPKTGR